MVHDVSFWPSGAATGVGSLPGDDIREALRVVLDELPDFPHLPELPARGPGSDMTGRTAALLVDLHVDLQPSGWRLVDHPGADERRAVSLLRKDLDALEELTQGYEGPLKIQSAGPWTLAAAVELGRGGAALADRGASRDLADSLAEGLAGHVAEVRKRVPGAEIVLQLDEPGLPGVLAGRIPTASGFARISAVEAPVVGQALGRVIAAAKAPVIVHCCGPGVPVRLIRRAGASAVSLDFATLTETDAEAVGEAVEADTRLLLGLVPALDPPAQPTVRQLVGRTTEWWGRLGFSPGMLAEVCTVTPTCGLTGASPAWARGALRLARQTGRALAEAGG